MLLIVLAVMVRLGALKRPGLIIGAFAVVYAMARFVLGILPRARRAARLPLGRRHHGPTAVDPAVPRRRWFHRLCAAASGTRAMTAELSPLEHDIRRRIAAAGPMPVGQYMALCLSDPHHGYYIKAIRSAPAAISSPRRR